MEPATNIPGVTTAIDDVFDCLEDANSNAYPEEKDSFAACLITGMDKMSEAIDSYLSENPVRVKIEEVSDLEYTADTSYFDSNQILKQANSEFIRTGSLPISDIKMALIKKAEGNLNDALLCSGDEATTLVNIYNETHANDKISCGTLKYQNLRIHDNAEQAFPPVRKPDGYNRPHHFSAGASYGINKLHRFATPEQSDGLFETDYDFINPYFRYQYALGEDKLPSMIAGSGPVAEVSASLVRGHQRNDNSGRISAQVSTGWQQSLFKYAFITPQFGLGSSFNELGFGEGAPVPETKTLMAFGQIQAGGQYCFNSTTCLLAFGGYFYEGTLSGAPEYLNYGPFAGSGLTIGFGSNSKEKK